MDHWTQQAFETFPYLSGELGELDTTLFDVLVSLRLRLLEAHEANDVQELQRIHGFAERCLQHSDREVSNQAAVVFYEHLVDDPVTLHAIPDWLAPGIFGSVCALFAARMNAADYQRLCDVFALRHGRMSELDKPPQNPAATEDWSV